MTITTPASWGPATSGTYAERVAAEVRAWMARRGITQTEMATAIGVTQMYVSRRVKRTDPTPMDVDDLANFSRVLDCRVTDLLPEVDPRQPAGSVGTPRYDLMTRGFELADAA